MSPADPETAIQADAPPPAVTSSPHVMAALPPTPLSWRLGLAVLALALGGLTPLAGWLLGHRAQAGLGAICFILIPVILSANIRAINRYTLFWGIALQLALAVVVFKVEIGGVRPGFLFFKTLADGIAKFLDFTSAGSQFVFGPLAKPDVLEKSLGNGNGFVFAFVALPTVIFVSSFFSLLYYLGILQWVVRLMARLMSFLMRTSGAETLSVSANVFLGQTEAPLMIKPYLAGMTQSELLCLMVGGMAHISGGLMAVYIGMGADAVSLLTTSVMAAPCSLYMAKLLLPESGKPQTAGQIKTEVARDQVNAIDAVAAGASDGMRLAINIAAMLIAFLGFIAMANTLLQVLWPDLTLQQIFGVVFSPLAYLIGLQGPDVPEVGKLLGIKLIGNEFLAYAEMSRDLKENLLTEQGRKLATFALTGFANIASIGIQIGGIGALAPSRRHDLARLGGWALLVGFLATLVNAALAGMLL
jgi:CNT family concentrative nucleoside transporter